MTNRSCPLSSTQRLQVGRVIAEMRQAGERWKAIECLFGMSRAQLRRYADALMEQKSLVMEQDAACLSDTNTRMVTTDQRRI